MKTKLNAALCGWRGFCAIVMLSVGAGQHAPDPAGPAAWGGTAHAAGRRTAPGGAGDDSGGDGSDQALPRRTEDVLRGDERADPEISNIYT